MDYVGRRKILMHRMANNSIAILFAGEEIIRNSDEMYEFCVNNNFFYLTGITQKDSILILKKIEGQTEEVLYLLNADPAKAKWEGDFLNNEEAKKVAQIDKVAYRDEFLTDFKRIANYNDPEAVYLDLEHPRSDLYNGSQFRNFLTKDFPALRIKNCFGELAKMRSVKDKDEIECLKKAIEFTKMGLDDVRATLKGGFLEYQMAAVFEYRLKASGIKKLAFPTIAASGKNATILHYNANEEIIKDNTLLLLDLGAKYQGYSADITRTYPVGGSFSDRQQLVYQLVLNGQSRVLAAVAPGVTTNELNDILREYYLEELQKLGLLAGGRQLDDYYWHGVSHSLGLDTHDVGLLRDQPLVAGNVITVEPGLYISEWEIGIRIEDNVLVTEYAYENLSREIAKEVSELEV